MSLWSDKWSVSIIVRSLDLLDDSRVRRRTAEYSRVHARQRPYIWKMERNVTCSRWSGGLGIGRERASLKILNLKSSYDGRFSYSWSRHVVLLTLWLEPWLILRSCAVLSKLRHFSYGWLWEESAREDRVFLLWSRFLVLSRKSSKEEILFFFLFIIQFEAKAKWATVPVYHWQAVA